MRNTLKMPARTMVMAALFAPETRSMITPAVRKTVQSTIDQIRLLPPRVSLTSRSAAPRLPAIDSGMFIMRKRVLPRNFGKSGSRKRRMKLSNPTKWSGTSLNMLWKRMSQFVKASIRLNTSGNKVKVRKPKMLGARKASPVAVCLTFRRRAALLRGNLA